MYSALVKNCASEFNAPVCDISHLFVYSLEMVSQRQDNWKLQLRYNFH